MEIKAKLLELYDTATISERFRKREFVVEYAENPQYPEYIKFEAIQDKCEMLDQFEIGQDIEIHFNLKGRKWVDRSGETKYFNSLQAWRILPVSQEQPEAAAPPTSSESNDIPPVSAYKEPPPTFDDEDLPF